MQKVRLWLVTASLLLCSIMVNAHDFEMNGIYYNITSVENLMVEVTHYGSYNSAKYKGEIIIPPIVNYNNKDYKVTAIGEYAFFACKVTSISIPEGVATVGYRAFEDCGSLTSINIPESVTSIGNSAFCGCSSLTSINIPESVTSIGGWAFYGCSSLTSITIPEGVTTIEEWTFYGCSALTSFIIPNSVTSIGMYAFRDCNLAVVVIGENVTSINGSAFQYGCRSIHTVINYSALSITKGTSNAGYVAYYATKVINIRDLSIVEDFLFSTKNGIHFLMGYVGDDTEIVLPDSYQGESYLIDAYCFYKCEYLTSITIPVSVTSIGEWAFYGCTNLANITIHSNPTIDSSAIPTETTMFLVLNDNNVINLDVNNANTFDEVVYSRELGAGKYGTIMLPFTPDAESVENFAFYSLSSVDGETLTFDEVATPVANTPYLYTLREGKSTTQITGGETTISSAIFTPEIDGWKTVGSFINQTVDCSAGEACYYAINAADNLLYNVVSKLNVKPYRAYFEGGASNIAKLHIRTRDGKETLINAAEVEDLAPATYYDLCGRQAANLSKGVYIVNGKKVVVK